MIITCNNCSKKFDIDSNLIPEKGRLLECNACKHKWFFKRDVIIETRGPAEVNLLKEQSVIEKVKTLENIELLDKDVKKKIELQNVLNKKNQDKIQKIPDIKRKRNYNILELTTVFILSFIALIVILDTFQNPISKIIPNIEFILYNLYETINDIVLFLKDLI